MRKELRKTYGHRRCRCGLEVSLWPAMAARHARAWWHVNYKAILAFDARGLNAAEIGERVGPVKRATAARYVKLWKKENK